MRIYEFSQDPRNFYLITEYCEGGELGNKVMKAKCFSEFTVSKLAHIYPTVLVFWHHNSASLFQFWGDFRYANTPDSAQLIIRPS